MCAAKLPPLSAPRRLALSAASSTASAPANSVEQEAAWLLLSQPLCDVLDTFPRFRELVSRLDEARRQRLLTVWGGRDASRLQPLLVRCLRQGKFRTGADQPNITEPGALSGTGVQLECSYLRRQRLWQRGQRNSRSKATPQQRLQPARRFAHTSKRALSPLPPSVGSAGGLEHWYATVYNTDYSAADDEDFQEILSRHLQDPTRNLLSLRNEEERRCKVERHEQRRRHRAALAAAKLRASQSDRSSEAPSPPAEG